MNPKEKTEATNAIENKNVVEACMKNCNVYIIKPSEFAEGFF